MVVVGYVATFATAADNLSKFTGLQIAVGVLFGIAYLILGMFDNELLGRFSESTSNIIYFSVQCLLVLGIGMLLGPGGNWLIGLPLAGIAVERLSSRWRWLVYGAVIVVIVLPIGFYSTWRTALMNGGIMMTAVFFVE